MRIGQILLVASLSLLVTSAPAGSRELASSSGLGTLDESLSNTNLTAPTSEISSIRIEDKLQKRKPPKKGNKNKGGTRNMVFSKDGKKTYLGTTAYVTAQKAAKNSMKVGQTYLFHETFAGSEYLFVAKINDFKELKIIKTSKLTKDTASPNQGESICEADFGEACSKHEFIMYSCGASYKSHAISARSQLKFFKKKDLQYSSDTFLLKDTTKTIAYESCADKKVLGNPSTINNVAQMKAALKEYYPGSWTQE